MRDPQRIVRILDKIDQLWSTYPDMRFGQFLVNVFPKYERNLFHPEDDDFEEALDKVLEHGW